VAASENISRQANNIGQVAWHEEKPKRISGMAWLAAAGEKKKHISMKNIEKHGESMNSAPLTRVRVRQHHFRAAPSRTIFAPARASPRRAQRASISGKIIMAAADLWGIIFYARDHLPLRRRFGAIFAPRSRRKPGKANDGVV